MPPYIDAREKKTPLWAMLVPLVYLLLCGLGARTAFTAHDDAGVPGLLAAVGLLPAFVVPVVFTTCKVRLSIVEGGLAIRGLFGTRIEKVDDTRLQHAARGAGVLHIVTRQGDTQTFLVPSYKDAQVLTAQLPPASAPASAVVA